MSPRSIHDVVIKGRIFFLKTEQYSVVCVYHTFFIYSSVDGRLGWLLWIRLQRTWECRYLVKIVISFPLHIRPEVGLLDHMVVLFLIFWATSMASSCKRGWHCPRALPAVGTCSAFVRGRWKCQGVNVRASSSQPMTDGNWRINTRFLTPQVGQQGHVLFILRNLQQVWAPAAYGVNLLGTALCLAPSILSPFSPVSASCVTSRINS